MPLKNRREFPPGGWIFYQIQDGWPKDVTNHFSGKTFEQVRDEIIDHRMKNPRPDLSTDPTRVAAELDDFTCLRLGNDPNWCLGGPTSKKVLGSPWRQSPGAGVAAVGLVVKNIVGGVRAWIEWLGPKGEVVDPALANHRAEVCARCPKNTAGGLLAFFSQPTAELIREQLSVKHEMGLSTPLDDRLQVCSACLCPIKLVIWATIEFKLKRLTPESKAHLHPSCWILSEAHALNNPPSGSPGQNPS